MPQEHNEFTDTHLLASIDTSNSVDALLSSKQAHTIQEAETILQHGPQVHDIAKALQIDGENAVTNGQVESFLLENYPLHLNNAQIRIAKISGSDKFILYDREKNLIEELSEEEYQERVKVVGLEVVYENTYLSYVTGYEGWIAIRLFNMGTRIPEVRARMLASLDYMKSEWDEFTRMKIYALALLAHEFLHRLQTEEIMTAYAAVAQASWDREDETWKGFPSEYSMFYRTKYKADDSLILREDLADSVQIYVINSSYLKERFPERYAFIQKNFPHIIENSAATSVLQKVV